MISVTHDEAREKTAFFINQLKQERLKQGLSQRNLAEAAGLNPSTVHLIEKGKRNPTLAVLLMLFDALGIDFLQEQEKNHSER
jgi:transcriptional regulator with XRE-family HTH domain